MLDVGRPQAKKRKLKRKVSELDPIAAKKRRTQTSLAQRAYRQRQEDAFLSLRRKVVTLHDTIEGLNNCFLSLTDALTASEWLGKDAHVADALRRAIETFLDLVQSAEDSQNRQDELPVQDYPEKSCVVKESQQNLDSSGDTTPGGIKSRTPVVRPNGSSNPLPRLTDNSLGNTFKHREAAASARVFKVSNNSFDSINVPYPSSVPHDISSLFSSTQLNLSFFPMPTWPSLGNDDENFAKRLHRAAFQGGYRLASNSERQFSDYQRVFKYTLNFHTKETLLLFLKKVVDENYERFFEAPEMSLAVSSIQSHFHGWINASEVSEYFRQKGYNFDGFPNYAELEIDAESADTDFANVTEASTLPLLHFPPLAHLGTVNVLNSRMDMFHRANSVRPKMKVKVDIRKLIDEIALPSQTMCLGRNPVFKKVELDYALRRSIIQDYGPVYVPL